MIRRCSEGFVSATDSVAQSKQLSGPTMNVVKIP